MFGVNVCLKQVCKYTYTVITEAAMV